MEIVNRGPSAAEWRVRGCTMILAVGLLLAADAPAPAQDAGLGLPSAAGVPGAGTEMMELDSDVAVSESTSVRESLLAYMEEKERSILHSLRTMPEDRYDETFVSGQRTFGQQARHVAEMNYAVCSALAGEQPPTPKARHESPKKRLVDVMRRSFEFCRARITDLDGSVLAGGFGTPDGDSLRKATMLFFLVGNWADHYGHFATYLRMSGLEPPDTWSLPAEILRATTRR